MSNFGVQILWTARYDYAKGERLSLHQHAFYQIFWIADGRGVFQCNDEMFELEPGTIFFVRPNQQHGLTVDDKQSVKTLDIKFQVVSDELARIVEQIPVKIHQHNNEVARLLELVRQEGMLRQNYYLELANLHVVELLYVLSRSAELQADRSTQRVVEVGSLDSSVLRAYLSPTEKVEQWILEHAEEDWTIMEIAKNLGYSPSYLCQLFKKNKGMTIANFLKEIRILRSKEWLTYADLSIKQIAEKVGFKTVHHFTRVFKEVEGITPGQWFTREKLGIRKNIVFDEG